MVKHCIQNFKNECGIACLKMFYDLYEVEKNYFDFLNEVKIEKEGVSIDEMLKSLKYLANFKAYYTDGSELKILCPSIIIVSKKNRNHYVVLWKYKNGLFYISDPIKEKIIKIKEKRLLKYFSGYVIFNQKRNVIIPSNYTLKIKSGPYKIPYLVLSILEVGLLTFSMLYLFSIKDFTLIKVYTFLIILFINFIISILKNLCFNYIQKNIDNKSIYNTLEDKLSNGNINSIDTLKEKLKIGYQIKNKYLNLLTSIMPSLFIIIGSLIYIFFINIIIFISILIIYIVIFLINIHFERTKNKIQSNMYQYEIKINLYDKKVLDKHAKEEVLLLVKKMKNESSRLLVISQINTIINFVIRQFCLMLILIFMYIYHQDIFSIFVITFYFYSFDGIISICSYLVTINESKYLKNNFINE